MVFETTVELERGTLTENLEELNYQVYKLEPPLQPGESITMKYTVAYEAKGFEKQRDSHRYRPERDILQQHDLPTDWLSDTERTSESE